jgi:TBC1 domain family member 14
MRSDDDRDSPPLHRPTASTSSAKPFHFDDAFSDTDDDLSYEFSPATIRQELEKNLSNHVSAEAAWSTDHELAGLADRIGFADNADMSVATFNIDGQYDNSLSPPTQQHPSPEAQIPSHPSEPDSLDEIALSTELSSVNLGESPQPDEEQHQHEPKHREELEDQYAEYPAVQIETSEERTGPTVVRVTTPPPPEFIHTSTPSTPPHLEQELDPARVPLPITPQAVTGASSTGSLPLAASVSLPTPSSATSSTSNSSTFASKHRTTKSAGPSMLDKVVSKTRPSFLPPKSRAEDQKHMADWETMMQRSRASGESGKELRLVAYIIDNQFSFLIRSVLLYLVAVNHAVSLASLPTRGEATESTARETLR